MTEILQNLLNAVEAVTDKPRQKSGKGFRLPCPAHNGKNRNLFICDGDKKLVIKCHSHQCDPKDIVEAAGLTLSDTYYERLSGKQLKKHRIQRNDRVIKKELEVELLVLLIWLSNWYQNIFPVNEQTDVERVKLAWKRVLAAAQHFTKEGVK